MPRNDLKDETPTDAKPRLNAGADFTHYTFIEARKKKNKK